jgi:hypothetical protein
VLHPVLCWLLAACILWLDFSAIPIPSKWLQIFTWLCGHGSSVDTVGGESSREIMVSIFIGALAATIRSHPTGMVLGLQQLFALAVVTPGGWGGGRGARLSG